MQNRDFLIKKKKKSYGPQKRFSSFYEQDCSTNREPEFHWHNGLCFGKRYTRRPKVVRKLSGNSEGNFYEGNCFGAQTFGQKNPTSVAEVVCSTPVITG